jgi:hypothetical protein
MWFVPNWISYPSSVLEYGIAITPALLIKMSRRDERVLNSSAAFLIAANEDKSSCKNDIRDSGTAVLISAIAASAFDGVRAARKISLGLCFAS